jgi:HEAT repeat protein
LGQIGNGDDAERFLPLLDHTRAAVREAAAVALGRLGEPGVRMLEKGFLSTEKRTRALVLAAVPHATSKRAGALLLKGAHDPDPWVRRHALAALGSLPPVLEKERGRLVKNMKRILANDADASIQAAVSLLN